MQAAINLNNVGALNAVMSFCFINNSNIRAELGLGHTDLETGGPPVSKNVCSLSR